LFILRAAAAQQAEREPRKLLFTQKMINYTGEIVLSGSPTGRERMQEIIIYSRDI
jgi:hypothetical protein